jgi:hypothetical protein
MGKGTKRKEPDPETPLWFLVNPIAALKAYRTRLPPEFPSPESLWWLDFEWISDESRSTERALLDAGAYLDLCDLFEVSIDESGGVHEQVCQLTLQGARQHTKTVFKFSITLKGTPAKWEYHARKCSKTCKPRSQTRRTGQEQ